MEPKADRATTSPASPQRQRRTDVARLPLRWAARSKTKEGELYRRVVRQLRQHLGGRPTAAQELLIGRIAWLQVHLAHIDERAMKDGGLSPHAVREYLAWSNTVAKLLGRLGMNATPAPAPSLADYFAARAAQAAATAAAAPSGAPDDGDGEEAPDGPENESGGDAAA